ncbi:MAG: methyltransferase domain-containing protein [Hyphomicrobiaceae bacterium]|nr:methyltransferase domain-containing protein [Hyphomicrobiaceae bacterium]
MPDARAPDLTGLPEAYHAWRTSELGQLTDRLEEELIAKLIGPLQGKRILDVGCGDGVLAVRLAEAGAFATGLDADPRMLTAARKRAEATGTAITFVDGDIHSLPFADGSFDTVMAITVLCFVRDAERAVQEMARVLRPGGRLVLGELGRYSLWAVKRRVAGWLGSKTSRHAMFRSASELRQLAKLAHLEVGQVRGAIYYPPCTLCPQWLAPHDQRLSTLTTFGAAFIALAADKPDRILQRKP